MKYKDLPRGAIFQFAPQPGTRETAIKAADAAYSLKTGERLTIHANRNCDALPPMTGDAYRLGVVGQNSRLVIFSQANETQVFCFDFLIIGHSTLPRDAVKPIIGKMELQEQAELVDIILKKLEKNAESLETLLKVLRNGIFEDFGTIKLT